MAGLHKCGKTDGVVILSEAKDLALSFRGSTRSRFTSRLRSATGKTPFECTAFVFDRAQSEILRFAPDDNRDELFHNC
jgi:hypothetical protein